MKQIIEYLMVADKGFYRHYPEMLAAFGVSIATECEKDEIRFMKGWKLKQLCRVLSPWQVRQCEEIRRESKRI